MLTDGHSGPVAFHLDLGSLGHLRMGPVNLWAGLSCPSSLLTQRSFLAKSEGSFSPTIDLLLAKLFWHFEISHCHFVLLVHVKIYSPNWHNVMNAMQK